MMDSVVLTSAGLVSLGVLSFLFVHKFSTHAIGTTDRPDLKGPPATSMVAGNMNYVSTHTDRLLEVFLGWRMKYGPGQTFTLPTFRFIDISQPSWMEYVQKTNFKNYVKGDNFSNIMKDVLGTGIFAVDGERWLDQRKNTSHIFTSNSFRGIITHSISEHLKIFVNFLNNSAKSNQSVALDEVFFRMTLDTFVKMAFGRDINSLKDGQSVPFAVAFDYSQNQMNWRFFNFHWPLSEKFSDQGKKMKEAVKTISQFAYEIIDKRANDPNSQNMEDLLSLVLKVKNEDGKSLTRDEVKDTIVNLVIAGRDTTAQALSWTFYHLIRNPDLYKKVRDEVKELDEVNYDNYKKLVFTTAVFHETLRLHPSVPKNARQCLSDDQIPNGGPKILKGEWVRWSDWQMARDPLVWGEDCSQFKPERFMDEKGGLLRFDNWKFHPFSGGPRICLGVNLATYEVVATIAALVKNFDMKFEAGWYEKVEKISGYGYEEDTPLYDMSLTLPMKNRMMVSVSAPSS